MAEKKRILIVEDEFSLGKMLQARLESMGYEACCPVSTGEEALEAASRMTPDLILLDIKLAGEMDGIEVGDQISKSLRVPIIYLTSHVDDEYIERAKLTEPMAYLLKPVNSQALRTTIEMAFARSEVERSLAESEQRYRALVETQVELVCRFSPDGTLTYVNESYATYFGCDKLQLIGSRTGLPSMRPNPDGLYTEKKFSAGLSSVSSYETRDTGFDGKPRYQRWTEVSLIDDRGKLIEIQSVGRDVTERKLADEDKLHRTEERFRAVFESTTDGIFILDGSMIYTHANSAGLNLLGLAETEIIGHGPVDVFGQEIGSKLAGIYSRVLKGASSQYEQTRKLSNVSLTFSESASPLKDFNGKVIGICCICRNITELKKVSACEVDEHENYISRSMRQTMALAHAAAKSHGTVCLLGESGAGKDRLARWIHDHSRRRSGPFVPINCAVLPESLAESELFGHERGAFTGASVQKRGLLELAEGGTILLNEIGELSTTLQSKLLSFIDNKSFLRVGGAKPITVDSRLMVATHRRLDEEVTEGRFMGPLFHRINVFPITVPRLNDRLEDIPLLCDELIQKLCCNMPMSSAPVLNAEHYRSLSDYNWPGNVRELRNVLERSLMLWKGGKFTLQLPTNQIPSPNLSFSIDSAETECLSDMTSKIVSALCKEMVARCKGNKSMAAKRLGISRDALYRRLRENNYPDTSNTSDQLLS